MSTKETKQAYFESALRHVDNLISGHQDINAIMVAVRSALEYQRIAKEA